EHRAGHACALAVSVRARSKRETMATDRQAPPKNASAAKRAMNGAPRYASATRTNVTAIAVSNGATIARPPAHAASPNTRMESGRRALVSLKSRIEAAGICTSRAIVRAHREEWRDPANPGQFGLGYGPASDARTGPDNFELSRDSP